MEQRQVSSKVDRKVAESDKAFTFQQMKHMTFGPLIFAKGLIFSMVTDTDIYFNGKGSTENQFLQKDLNCKRKRP